MILNAAPPRKGRDSVKLTALSTAIPGDTGTRRKLNFQQLHQCTKFNRVEALKDYLRNTDVNIKHKLKTSKQEASRRMKQEETQKQKKTILQ